MKNTSKNIMVSVDSITLEAFDMVLQKHGIRSRSSSIQAFMLQTIKENPEIQKIMFELRSQELLRLK